MCLKNAKVFQQNFHTQENEDDAPQGFRLGLEPGAEEAADLPEVRKLAFEDLDRCMYVICRDTLAYLEEKGAEIDDMTQKACDYYKDLFENKRNCSAQE